MLKTIFTKIRFFLSFILIIFVLFVSSARAESDEIRIHELNTSSFSQEEAALYAPDKVKVDESIIEKIDETVEEPVVESRGQILLGRLYKQLEANQSTSSFIDANIKNTKEKIWQIDEKVETLEGQLAILDHEITETRDKIDNVRYHIAQIGVELRNMYEEIELKTIELESQRKLLMDYLQLLYYQRNLFFDVNHDDLSIVKLLLADESVSYTMRESTYLSLMEQEGQKIFDHLFEIKSTLNTKTKQYEDKRVRFDELNERLMLELKLLKEQENSKAMLLDETKGQEELYKQLLIYAKIEQQQVLGDIKNLRDNIDYIKDKLDTMDENEIILLESTINERSKRNYLMGVTTGDIENMPVFSWPVFPSKGLSAYFKDESYRAHFGIPHYAIDIPVPQGTPIHSPAAGIVTQVVDNGYGYSYIIVAHKDDFATLYGHVYSSNVRIGDATYRGDILGFSGGAPGTKGAGLLTTGPHLHFEVFKDGTQVDPMLFLPLRYIPLEKLPEKYHELLDAEKEKLRESEASAYIDSISKQIDEEMLQEKELIETDALVTPT